MSEEDEDFIDGLEALFAAVVAKARADAAFARALARAVGGRWPREAPAHERPAEAPDLDPAALLETDGADGLRRALRGLTRPQLLMLIRARDLAPAGTGRLNKAALIEHIARTVARARAPEKRAFDY